MNRNACNVALATALALTCAALIPACRWAAWGGSGDLAACLALVFAVGVAVGVALCLVVRERACEE